VARPYLERSSPNSSALRLTSSTVPARQRSRLSHSITSSARASSLGGTSRPSAFARRVRADRTHRGRRPGHRAGSAAGRTPAGHHRRKLQPRHRLGRPPNVQAAAVTAHSSRPGLPSRRGGPTSSMTRRAITAGPDLVRCSAVPLLLHDDRRADLDPVIEIDHVLIGQANAAR
jgi:hypothetical protein